MNAWHNPDLVAAVRATGKWQLIVAGTIGSVCVALPAIAAVDDGYQVFAVMDASGNYSKMAEAITLARIEQAGVVPIDTIALCAELQKTWNCQDAAQWTELYAASINRVHRNTEHVSRAALSQDIAGLRATGLELAP